MAKSDIVPGSKVNVVTAHDGPIEAKVLNVHSATLLDLQLHIPGQEKPMVITSSPYDPTAQMPDSWHKQNEAGS